MSDDGYDYSFEYMVLAADRRLGRELGEVRRKQLADLCVARKKHEKMLDENLPGVNVNPNAPFHAVLGAVAGATSQPRPNFMYTDDIGESTKWCRDAILSHVKHAQALSQKKAPARMPLNREQALQLMQHIEACADLLKG